MWKGEFAEVMGNSLSQTLVLYRIGTELSYSITAVWRAISRIGTIGLTFHATAIAIVVVFLFVQIANYFV